MRDRVRDPAAWRDGKALAELARAASRRSSPYLCCWRWANGCRRPVRMGSAFSDASGRHFPEDFWANFTLALALHVAGQAPGGRSQPSLVYYEKALEIRPQAVAVLNDLGVVLLDKDWMWDDTPDGGGPGACTVFYQVVKSDARFAPGFNNLGAGPEGQGRLGGVGAYVPGRLGGRSAPAAAHFNLAEIRAGSG